MMTSPPSDQLAHAAVAPITSGMVVGLGTGRAAARGVRALAERVRSERLDITCVATSRATEELAGELGLRVVDCAGIDRIDYLFDGADEVDPNLCMVKGGGGAMTRERIVASATKQRVYMIDASKLVPRLGTRMPLPIEVIPMARAIVEKRLLGLGLEGVYRQRGMSGSSAKVDYLTDNGNLVFDAAIPAHISADADALKQLAATLDGAGGTGIVDHGLFLDECQTLLIEWPDGNIERRDRVSEVC